MKTFYECQRCAACCRWPGQVKVESAEIDGIAAFLKMDVGEFIRDWTRLRPDRSGLALREQENGQCVFLDGIDCRIQAVKPTQCAGFPNTWRFPGFENVCEARPREVSDEEYARLVRRGSGTESIDAHPS